MWFKCPCLPLGPIPHIILCLLGLTRQKSYTQPKINIRILCFTFLGCSSFAFETWHTLSECPSFAFRASSANWNRCLTGRQNNLSAEVSTGHLLTLDQEFILSNTIFYNILGVYIIPQGQIDIWFIFKYKIIFI